jgi:hypothetical protein
MSYEVNGSLANRSDDDDPGRIFGYHGAVELDYLKKQNEIRYGVFLGEMAEATADLGNVMDEDNLFGKRDMGREEDSEAGGVDEEEEDGATIDGNTGGSVEDAEDQDATGGGTLDQEVHENSDQVDASEERPSEAPEEPKISLDVTKALNKLTATFHRHHRARIPFSDWSKYAEIQTETIPLSSLFGSRAFGFDVENGDGLICRDYNPNTLTEGDGKFGMKIGEIVRKGLADVNETAKSELKDIKYHGKKAFTIYGHVQTRKHIEKRRLQTQGIFEPPFSPDDDSAAVNTTDALSVETDNSLRYREIRRGMKHEDLEYPEVNRIVFDGKNLVLVHVSTVTSY